MSTKTDRRPRRTGRSRARTPRRQRLVITGFGVVVVVVLAFVVFVAANSSKTSEPGGGPYRFVVGDPGPGKPAPAIVLPETGGATFDLGAARGKTVLLYFQEGVGCQPCWDQMRDIRQQWPEFTAAGIDEFVTITSDPLGLVAQKIRQDRLTGPVLADTSLTVSKTYNANHYGMMGDARDGHTFIVVGPDGTIRWRADYGGSPDYTMYVPVASLLAALTAGLGHPPTTR